MISMKLALLGLAVASGLGSYLPVRRIHRHRLVATHEKLVPDPDATRPRLNQVENIISQWNSTLPSPSPLPPDPSLPHSNPIGELGASIEDIQNQSNQDMAQLSATLSSNALLVDAIRANVSQIADETRRNISRINSLIGDISDYSTSTLAGNAETIQAQLKNLQAEVDMLAGNNSASASIPSQILEIDNAIASLEQRVGTLETKESLSSQVLASDTSGAVDNNGLDFILYSWTGRIALVGTLVGVLALILASVALHKLPKSAEVPDTCNDDEQVLLEAGGEQPAATEEQQVAYDPNDPNAQQYYTEQEAVEEEQQQ